MARATKNYWQSCGSWGALVGVVAALLGLLLLLEHGEKLAGKREGYEEREDFVVLRGTDVYDDFYTSVYDALMFSQIKNQFEIGTIVNVAGPAERSLLLDVGSGTGHHAGAFKNKGYSVVGIDLSPSMVAAASKRYPEIDFRVGDALDGSMFSPGSFTHITCLYFTIYYMRDKVRFLKNCFYWLTPGGYLTLHLVDRNAFSPIIPAGDPFVGLSPQSYAEERITSTEVLFDTQRYKAGFALEPESDTATLTETFTGEPSGSVRRNEHTLYMEPQRAILRQAKAVGFIMTSQADMEGCGYDGQYLYVLQKPS
jgi:SAM-dependent methyltransferase